MMIENRNLFSVDLLAKTLLFILFFPLTKKKEENKVASQGFLKVILWWVCWFIFSFTLAVVFMDALPILCWWLGSAVFLFIYPTVKTLGKFIAYYSLVSLVLALFSKDFSLTASFLLLVNFFCLSGFFFTLTELLKEDIYKKDRETFFDFLKKPFFG